MQPSPQNHNSSPRPEAPIEQKLISTIDGAIRDLRLLLDKVPTPNCYRLALAGLEQIQAHGIYAPGYSQREVVFVEALSPWAGRKVKIHLQADVRDEQISPIGINYMGAEGEGKDRCVFRLYVRLSKQCVETRLREMHTLRNIMRAEPQSGDDAKWNNFKGTSAVGEWSETPIAVTTSSLENYQRMERLNIDTKNTEDLAAFVVRELQLPSL